MARGEPSLESALSAALPHSGTLLLAVSGGADSIALLRAVQRSWLVSNSPKKIARRNVIVAHINHGLRKASARDETFVRTLCKKLKIRCIVRTLRGAPQTNIEAWARTARYAALQRVRRSIKASWILTAHNRNDVAETFLIKMLQNRDSMLLAPVDRSRRLIRPLLSVSRREIEVYLTGLGQRWCDDESNADITFARNWVRHDLLPMLEQRWGSGLVRSLAERAEAQRIDRIVADCSIQSALKGIPIRSLRSVTAMREKLSAVPAEAQPLLACAWLARCYKLRVGRLHGASISALIKGERQAVQLPQDRHLTVYKGFLRLRRL